MAQTPQLSQPLKTDLALLSFHMESIDGSDSILSVLHDNVGTSPRYDMLKEKRKVLIQLFISLITRTQMYASLLTLFNYQYKLLYNKLSITLTSMLLTGPNSVTASNICSLSAFFPKWPIHTVLLQTACDSHMTNTCKKKRQIFHFLNYLLYGLV